jgi:hypothetical protein
MNKGFDLGVMNRMHAVSPALWAGSRRAKVMETSLLSRCPALWAGYLHFISGADR